MNTRVNVFHDHVFFTTFSALNCVIDILGTAWLNSG
jgi:hypothetical protein